MVYFENPDGDDVVKDNYVEIARYIDMFAELKKALPSAAETNDHLDMIIARHEAVTAS